MAVSHVQLSFVTSSLLGLQFKKQLIKHKRKYLDYSTRPLILIKTLTIAMGCILVNHTTVFFLLGVKYLDYKYHVLFKGIISLQCNIKRLLLKHFLKTSGF